MPQENDEQGAFKRLLTRLVGVPKREIDAEEKRETRNKSRRKTPKHAKPRHILPDAPTR